MTKPLDDRRMDELRVKIAEAMRSTGGAIERFIEPAAGTLADATSQRHHIVFGRRGSGKTSLLRKAAAELTVDRRPIAFVDLEAYKGHSYPDVLLSVLISAFERFQEWLTSAGINPASKTTFWQKLFGTKPTRPPMDRKAAALLAADLGTLRKNLLKQLYSADDVQVRLHDTHETESGKIAGAHVGADAGPVKAELQAEASASERRTLDTEKSFRAAKVDFLRRRILDYQNIFRRVSKISDGASYLFLDDLYHIRRADQASVIDYFHGIAKGEGSRLWLKVGTITHRSTWYVHGDPPLGLKLGDDADPINLDITLEKYSLAKKFLLDILEGFAADVGLDVDDFLAEGAKDRLVLASGGVARDFLAIFRQSIDVARERCGGHRGNKIGAEDVNMASGEHDSSKQEEFKRDASADEVNLLRQFDHIKRFCLEGANSNCFLVHQDASGPAVQSINELVDLKLLHLVRSRVTVSGKIGQVYKAFMLDLSQYAGARTRRKLDIIRFWLPEAKERLRKAKLVYLDADGTTKPAELDVPRARPTSGTQQAFDL